jgi:hypothetical protein
MGTTTLDKRYAELMEKYREYGKTYDRERLAAIAAAEAAGVPYDGCGFGAAFRARHGSAGKIVQELTNLVLLAHDMELPA